MGWVKRVRQARQRPTCVLTLVAPGQITVEGDRRLLLAVWRAEIEAQKRKATVPTPTTSVVGP